MKIIIYKILFITDIDPCNPSPCGPNSICRVSNGHAVCSCQPGLIGSPPSCKPECVVSAECALTLACLQNKCRDPCPGTCGLNAKCNVINHNPICSCPHGYVGDPFRHCQLAPRKYFCIWMITFDFIYWISPDSSYFSPTSRTNKTSKPMYTISMWSKCSVSSSWRHSCLLLFSKLYRSAAKLSTRVHYKSRVCFQFSLH